jgi:hypothetical protein
MAKTSTETRIEAARLLDTDEPVGVNAWPLGCYVSEAVENELDALSRTEKARSYEQRAKLAYRRAINMSGSYAEQWGINIDVFRAAVEIKRLF